MWILNADKLKNIRRFMIKMAFMQTYSRTNEAYDFYDHDNITNEDEYLNARKNDKYYRIYILDLPESMSSLDFSEEKYTNVFYCENIDDYELNDDSKFLYQLDENFSVAYLAISCGALDEFDEKLLANFKDVLFKYTDINDLKGFIKNKHYYKYHGADLISPISGQLRFSDPRSFNDPFDCDYGDSKKEDFKAMYKVLCMSTSYKNVALWYHYGNKHSGCCYKYNLYTIIESVAKKHIGLCIIGRIKYSSINPSRYKATRIDAEYITNMALAIFTKGICWEYEKEYRITLVKGTENNFDVNPEEVYLGYKTIFTAIPPTYKKVSKAIGKYTFE